MNNNEDKKISAENSAVNKAQNPIANGRERRAYERYPVRMQARVNSQGMVARDCVVRDFCVGGMYLAYESSTEDAEAAQLCSPVKDDEVNIECTLPVTGSVETLNFSARVVRKKGDGLALRFSNPDLTALQILLDFAKSLGKKDAGQNDDEASSVPLNSENFNGKSSAEIIERCNQMVNYAAASLVVRFYEDIVDYLFEVSKSALDIAEQNAYFDALKVLNNSKDILRKSFLEAVAQQLESYSPSIPRFVENDEGSATISSLSIVDDEVFDDWLADTATVDSVELRNKEVLTEMERRLSLLYDAEIKRSNNPYGPALFARLFHGALKPLELRHKVNLACYKVFRNVLLELLDGVYSKINHYFIDNDVMPVISYSTPNSAKEKSPAGEDPSAGEEPSADVEVPTKEKASAEVALDTKSSLEVAGEENNRPASQSAEGQESAETAEASHPESGQDLYQLVGELKTLQQQLSHHVGSKTAADLAQGKIPTSAFLNQSSEQASSFVSGVSSGDGGEGYSREEVQAALSLVKPALNSIASDGVVRDFKADLMEELSKRHGDDHKDIGVRESRIIDVASNFFHWMSADLQVSEKVRGWIEQLELPVIKIAVDDESLFTDRTHLVRQVINKVAQLEMLVGESEKTDQPAVKKALDWIVGLVNEEFDGSTDVFARAVHQLDVLLNVQDKSYNANLRNLIEASKQEETSLLQTDYVDVTESDVDWDDVRDDEKALWIKRANRLNEGDWILVEADTDKPRRLRVAWKAERTQRIVFANVLGEKDIVLRMAELAKELRSGSAVLLNNDDADTVMDRAQHSILQDLHKQLLHQSTHDQLTGLMSRREFEKQLEESLSLAKENQSRHVVCFIDLDQFNVINSACGYEGGDQLLKELTSLLSKQLKEDWVLARLGSDEFGLLLKNCALDDALDFVEELLDEVQEYRLQWETKRLSVGLSIGLVPVSKRSDPASELLQAAESSCSIAKEMGGNRIQLYNSSHAGMSQRRSVMKWAAEIDRILDEDTLYLRCQRIMPIEKSDGTNSDAKDHYEILLGVWDLNGGDISTPEFIEAAERYKRMPDVDRWVIKNSFRWIVEHHQELEENIDMFSINLSGRSLNDESFLAFLLEQIDVSEVPVEKISFEVTETAGVANISDAIDFIEEVKATGCLFSLDDFGTGMSSYAYLKNLPVDYLKIDGAFVKDMANNPSDYAVVKSICEIGHFMGKKVIAEFVENDEILVLLKELGVDYAQGYGVEKPFRLEDLLKPPAVH